MQTARAIAKSPYLRLIAATVFLTAIVTQWTGLQLSLVTSRHFNSEATALTRFNGTFTLALGIVSFLVQLFATSQALRKFGLAVTILALPLSLGLGTALIVLAPAFWSVLVTNAFDQGLRFSVDGRPTSFSTSRLRRRTACHSRTPSTSLARGWRMRWARSSTAS